MARRAGTAAAIALAGLVRLAQGAEEASATASPPPAHSGGVWQFGWHGYAFLDVNVQAGPSGGRDFESINHFMLFGSRPLGAWTMSLLGTFSLEPVTVPVEGSPLLFQRGETFNDELLIDKQHAHDLFVQLGASWERPLTANSRLNLFAGLRGEPAVGPEAFPHRRSASEMPMAPLSHHNLDSTHISDDVINAGYTVSHLTVEGSWFHGAEPDEDRFDLDQGALDSYAGRLTVRPIDGLSFQVSACHREDPEALEEGDQTRVTASVSWDQTLKDGFIAALLATGKNELPDGDSEWGSILEATWNLRSRHYVYSRLERVDRDIYELTNKVQRPDTVPPDPTTVETLVLGYSVDLALLREASTAVGGSVALDHYNTSLDPVYGDSPVSYWVYLRLRFGSKQGHAHHH